MISIQRTFCPVIIGAVMGIPEIYDLSSDDNSKPLSEYNPADTAADPHTYRLACYDDDRLMGLCILRRKSDLWCDAHVAFLPEHRGKRAIIAARMAVKWIFDNTDMEIIRGKTPSYNHRAINFSRLVGFTCIGIERSVFIKNGIKFDYYVSGIRRTKHV